MTDTSEANVSPAEAAVNEIEGSTQPAPEPAPASEPAPAPADSEEGEGASDEEMQEFYADEGFGDDALDTESEEDSDLGEEGDTEEEGEPEAQPAVEPAEGGEAAAEPAAEEPAEPQQPAPEAEPAPAQEPSPEPAAEQPAPLSPEEYNRFFNETRDAAIEQLTGHYALNDEMAEELEEAPEKALPRMAARLHFDIMVQTLNAVANQLPAAFESYMHSRDDNAKSEDAFFNAWPGLKSQDRSAIARISQAYRQSNPNASMEQFIQEVGTMASVALKVPLEAAPQAPAAGGNGATPPPAVAATPAPEAESRPFVPAGGGGAARGGAPGGPTNPYEQVDAELFEDDDDDLG